MSDHFERFWASWPGNTATYGRKGSKAQCRKRWLARHHDTQADQIVRHVEWLKTTADWLKDGGAYVPAPLVYLNQQRWDGAEIPCETCAIDKASRSWLNDYEDAKLRSQSPAAIEARRRFMERM
jgi:hypothetical protein